MHTKLGFHWPPLMVMLVMMMMMMMISNGSFLEKCEKSSNGFATNITSFERGWILWEQFTEWKLAPARERASERTKNECALEQAVSQASPTATAYGVDATGRGFKPGRGRVLDCFNIPACSGHSKIRRNQRTAVSGYSTPTRIRTAGSVISAGSWNCRIPYRYI
jgi:hypothetical protein